MASAHIEQIPQAVRIAASQDPSIDSTLKQGAVTYLNEVKERSEETWQVRLSHVFQSETIQLICRTV